MCALVTGVQTCALPICGGSIVNIASVAGLQGGHPSLLYPTSKGAVVNLTRAMAAHHGRDGIRVNCIAPGSVYTPMVATRGMTDEMRAARVDQTLLGVEGTGWDIAHGCLFLGSDESRWITGVILPIDGGRTAGRPKGATPPSDGGTASGTAPPPVFREHGTGFRSAGVPNGGCAGTDGGRSGNWVGRPGWVDRGWVDRAGRAGGSSRPRRGSGRVGLDIDGVADSRHRAGEPVAAGYGAEILIVQVGTGRGPRRRGVAPTAN